MAISRNAIAAALFARLQTKVTNCKTFLRRWKDAQTIGIEQQPALLCLEGRESPLDDPPRPPVWSLFYDVVVYVRTQDAAAPGKVISDILDQIEAAMEPQPGEGIALTRAHTTLNIPGVQRAWICGDIEKEDGSLTNGQGWISVPICVLVAQ